MSGCRVLDDRLAGELQKQRPERDWLYERSRWMSVKSRNCFAVDAGAAMSSARKQLIMRRKLIATDEAPYSSTVQ